MQLLPPLLRAVDRKIVEAFLPDVLLLKREFPYRFLARVVRDAQGIFVRAFGVKALIETFESLENAPVSRGIHPEARRRRMKASGA